MEEAEAKPLLLIEVYEDPADKNMPYKLRINKEALAALTPSSERYVECSDAGRSSNHLRPVPLWQVFFGEPAAATDYRVRCWRHHPSLHKGNMDLVFPYRSDGRGWRRVAAGRHVHAGLRRDELGRARRLGRLPAGHGEHLHQQHLRLQHVVDSHLEWERLKKTKSKSFLLSLC